MSEEPRDQLPRDAAADTKERLEELVLATRRLLEWASVPDDSFVPMERGWYLSYAPARLEAG